VALTAYFIHEGNASNLGMIFQDVALAMALVNSALEHGATKKTIRVSNLPLGGLIMVNNY